MPGNQPLDAEVLTFAIAMQDAINAALEERGDSWKRTLPVQLEQNLLRHIETYFRHTSQHQNDTQTLINIANYCLFLYHHRTATQYQDIIESVAELRNTLARVQRRRERQERREARARASSARTLIRDNEGDYRIGLDTTSSGGVELSITNPDGTVQRMPIDTSVPGRLGLLNRADQAAPTREESLSMLQVAEGLADGTLPREPEEPNYLDGQISNFVVRGPDGEDIPMTPTSGEEAEVTDDLQEVGTLSVDGPELTVPGPVTSVSILPNDWSARLDELNAEPIQPAEPRYRIARPRTPRGRGRTGNSERLSEIPTEATLGALTRSLLQEDSDGFREIIASYSGRRLFLTVTRTSGEDVQYLIQPEFDITPLPDYLQTLIRRSRRLVSTYALDRPIREFYRISGRAHSRLSRGTFPDITSESSPVTMQWQSIETSWHGGFVLRVTVNYQDGTRHSHSFHRDEIAGNTNFALPFNNVPAEVSEEIRRALSEGEGRFRERVNVSMTDSPETPAQREAIRSRDWAHWFNSYTNPFNDQFISQMTAEQLERIFGDYTERSQPDNRTAGETQVNQIQEPNSD